MEMIQNQPRRSLRRKSTDRKIEMIPNQKRRRLRRSSTCREISLPEETIEQILVKLPFKSVLRFKSVCKLWLSLISRPTFKNLQLNHIDHQIIIASAPGPDCHKFFLPGCPKFYLLNQQDGKAVERKYSIPSFPDLNCFSLLGSCNGLLLGGIRTLSSTTSDSYYDAIVLWNPLFNDYKKIPFDNLSIHNFSGFCYDSYTQDYKLVNIDMSDDEVEGEIYNLKSDSKRRLHYEIHHDFGSTLTTLSRHGRVFKGCLYWISLIKNETEAVLLEFNVRYEKFSLINLPPNFKKVVSTRRVELDVVNRDCLGIFFYDYRIDNYFNLVTMKKEEDGSSISWNVVKIQNLEDKVGWPICMVSDDAILMRLVNRSPKPKKNPTNYDLIIYNPSKKTITNTGIHGAGDVPDYMSYTESLFLPGSAE